MSGQDEHRVTVTVATEPGWSRSWGGHTYRIRNNSWSHTAKHQPGDWIVHCGLCKDRAQLPDHATALAYARTVHPQQPAHQRWVGVVAQGGELPFARGYDSTSGHQCERNVFGAPAAEQRGESFRTSQAKHREALDDLAARRHVQPPAIVWATGQPLGPATVTWSDGRYSSGTFYNLHANGTKVARIVALSEGGWFFNGRYMPDDAALIREAS